MGLPHSQGLRRWACLRLAEAGDKKQLELLAGSINRVLAAQEPDGSGILDADPWHFCRCPGGPRLQK